MQTVGVILLCHPLLRLGKRNDPRFLDHADCRLASGMITPIIDGALIVEDTRMKLSIASKFRVTCECYTER